MKKINDFLLAGIIFVELFIGIVVAPIIFYPSAIIGDGILSHFQSGLLMTQVFVKFNYLLLFVSFLNIIYESISNKLFSLKPILSLIILILALVFVFYHTANVLDMQALGITDSKDFNDNHKQSEMIFKVMVILQLILFFTKKKEK
ncbi:DUF4149 domain-containing protein [Campylobacter sp. RM12654]|uniref:DUF4149 domain-containing protein n=1 Tax=unclassified Campylobacter TaxID=2593542 RepID=UPI001BDB64EE|nr:MULTISPECIES: DUF4149 domain-containing protein [unclassified Campylobacter]MBT0879298.1 DUF4149 domain-containing protein [Campylobacter sp. 2018MI01]MBT0882924.1 DUF4149 domain-containing protein [Campylobacter sp. 2018MI13]MBZ7977847.1 DUF4149 domain-containing protein [Campylobacter sp. RM12654]MBZ7992981.1 DUF4149 domain-containing protein [Campylobacter sp. RM9333]